MEWRLRCGGEVVAIDGAGALVAGSEQPTAWSDDGRWGVAGAGPGAAGAFGSEDERAGAGEAVKPGRGGARIDEAGGDGGRLVFAGVEQDVAEREADGARCLQGARVVAVGKEAAAAAEPAIDGAREAHAQALNAARERVTIFGLCQEMQVIALHGEVYERKAAALIAGCERGAYVGKQRAFTQ